MKVNNTLVTLSIVILLFGVILLLLSVFTNPNQWIIPLSVYFVAIFGLVDVFVGATLLYLISLPKLGIE